MIGMLKIEMLLFDVRRTSESHECCLHMNIWENGEEDNVGSYLGSGIGHTK